MKEEIIRTLLSGAPLSKELELIDSIINELTYIINSSEKRVPVYCTDNSKVYYFIGDICYFYINKKSNSACLIMNFSEMWRKMSLEMTEMLKMKDITFSQIVDYVCFEHFKCYPEKSRAIDNQGISQILWKSI